MLTTTTYDSPVGELTVTVSPVGVRALLWPAEAWDGRQVFIGASPDDEVHVERSSVPSLEHPLLAETLRQLDEYFAGTRRQFDLPLDPVGTPFQLRTWKLLSTIPYGQTLSYGEQARRLGDDRLARAVGAANGRNPISIIVPCHRVVGANGSLVGFGGGLDAKRWLLTHESDTLF